MLDELFDVIVTTLWMIVVMAAIFALFLVVSGIVYFVWNLIANKRSEMKGYGSLKTVTFGDESSVSANRVASIAGVVTVFLIWSIATGSTLLGPVSLPKPFTGIAQFEYTAVNAAGETGKVK